MTAGSHMPTAPNPPVCASALGRCRGASTRTCSAPTEAALARPAPPRPTLPAQARGLPPDVCTYTSLISGCAYGRQAALARELLRQMEGRGLEANTWTRNALLKARPPPGVGLAAWHPRRRGPASPAPDAGAEPCAHVPRALPSIRARRWSASRTAWTRAWRCCAAWCSRACSPTAPHGTRCWRVSACVGCCMDSRGREKGGKRASRRRCLLLPQHRLPLLRSPAFPACCPAPAAAARHAKRPDVAELALAELAGQQAQHDAEAGEAAAGEAGEADEDHRWHGYYEQQEDEDEW